jgi:oxygen-independent coproporphyrinogen-3 oxidase
VISTSTPPRALLLTSLPPLSLYVHFPWCVRKCPYCDFNSHALQGILPEQQYVDALLADLEGQAASIAGRPLRSVFLGGGTPSLFSPAALGRLLEALSRQLPLAADLEVTLEANPGTMERGRFDAYRAAGITRVSLGAQSFDPAQLQRLGRIHGAEDTQRAALELHTTGLSNFNLDLMYGLPQQTTSEALRDLEQAIALQPAHLSHYQLTLEPGTVFAGRPPAGLPDGDACADMQLACQQLLHSAGYQQYEVSAYARPGARCQHNLNYWGFGDYLGIGAGAHGKRSAFIGGALRVERSVQKREPRRYLASCIPEWRVVAREDLCFEFMLNALRLNEGFDCSDFEARTGLPISAALPGLQSAQQRGLLECEQSRWRPNAMGLNFLNDLLSPFLSQSRPRSSSAQPV